MPDVEALMQVWPEEFENMLSDIVLPDSQMDCSLDEYAKVICNIMVR